MTFTEAVRVCFVKYAVFDGCSGPREFWWFMLFLLLGSVVLGEVSDSLTLAFTLGTLLPSSAVTTRRLHDTNRSGWAQAIMLIPIIGWIVIIVWCVQSGVRPNRYCADPQVT